MNALEAIGPKENLENELENHNTEDRTNILPFFFLRVTQIKCFSHSFP